jgi:hypothetical protein
MADETSKDKLDWAYRALGINPEASRKALEEAYRNAREASHPDNFKGDARQQARAISHLKRLEEAYIAVKAQTIPKGSLVDQWYRQPHTTGTADYPAHRTDHVAESESGASLVDDIRRSHPVKRFPVWMIVPAILVPIALASVLFYQPADSIPAWGEAASEAGVSAETDPHPALIEQPLPQAELDTEEDTNAFAEPGLKATADAATLPPEPQPRRAPVDPPAIPARPAPKSAVPKSVTGEALEARDTPKLVRAPEILTAEAEREAFELLVLKSSTARDLIQDNNPFFGYLGWEAAARDAGQFFVTVQAEAKDTGQAVRFIWAVDTNKQTARAMSQAARDLEAAANR